MNYLTQNNVDVCYKDVCVKAKGKNAEWITYAIIFVLICAGVRLLTRSLK